MIKEIFEQLAYYYRHENDLSNIVVALCNSNSIFKEMFVKFFFPDIKVSDVESILREVPDKNNMGSRVDIFINMANQSKPYIVEVKIDDRNHHFGQYEEAYEIGKERFGYITNYECLEGRESGYDVKTWEDFYEYLSESRLNDEVINAFGVYLKNVCGIIKYENPMNIKGLSAIPCFVETVRKIILKERNWIKTSFYREYAYSSSIHEGFKFKFPQNNEYGFALFGLWFQEKPIISIAVNSRHRLSERIITEYCENSNRERFFKVPYMEKFWDKDDVWFEMSDDGLHRFINADTYEEQKRILAEFFEEVMKELEKYM